MLFDSRQQHSSRELSPPANQKAGIQSLTNDDYIPLTEEQIKQIKVVPVGYKFQIIFIPRNVDLFFLKNPSFNLKLSSLGNLIKKNPKIPSMNKSC